MAEQGLQSVPEMIDGDKVKEAEVKIEETGVNEEEIGKEEEDDEEFYERIEAPKFVDFTKPNPFRPDDRYWFCSRVGCDQKHEEEIDPEEISKNFVLRVLAARSPNIKLQKALNGKRSSMKCPLSAPAKPSKPRIPRLGMVSSSICRKIDDPESKIKPPSKVGSTPVAKFRQVAAKYMTTPRNKKCLPNPNSFQSVQNPKTTSVHVPKNRNVAKALTFNSPKKAISLKKSVELHTPLKKICEGMKRLEITSQKKTSKGIRNSPKKPETEDSSRRQLRVQSKDSKSTKIRIKKILTPKLNPLNEKVIEKRSSGVDIIDVKPKDGSCTLGDSRINGGNICHEQCLPSDSTKNEEVLQLQEAAETEMNVLTNLEDKENTGSTEDHSNDDKENVLSSEDINREFNNPPLGDKILGKETDKKNKVVRTLDKNLKGGPGPALVKYKKPKPTNIKPFRLRTDERGILKEAILERKLHLPGPKKEVAKDTCAIKKTYHIQAGTTDLEITKGQMGSKPAANTQRIRPESTQQKRGNMTSLKIRSPCLGQQPQGDTTKLGKHLTSGSRSASTKQPVTIAKEPNFHTSHLPRSCSKKVA